MAQPSNEPRLALDMWRAEREGPAGLARRQDERLAHLVRYARDHSRSYRRAFRDLPLDGVRLGDLPPVSKPELMADFDAWLTDPGVTLERVEAFVADPSLAGVPFQGEYYVCSSSGTTGHPGLFVHDRGAVTVYRALSTRVDRAWLSGVQWLRLARQGMRWATVVGTGGHFAGESWTMRERRRPRRGWGSRRVISAQRPLAEVVAELDAFDPAVVTAYPSVLELLADEQAAGRLRIHPVVVETAGESMLPEDRARVSAALGGTLHDAYGASEFELMAFDCPHGWLHVNSDWLVLEPVDADLLPVPPGEPSHTVLLTNLANHIQPLIRYDLGDSVLARPDRCPCGSPLPAIRVEGRRDDVLRLTAAGGRRVSVPPLAVGSVVERTRDVYRWQLAQDGPSSVRLRLEVRPGTDADAVWRDVAAGLSAYLADQGLARATVVRDDEPPERSAASGKLRQVIGQGSASVEHAARRGDGR